MALKGKKIMIDPSGGLYKDEKSQQWVFQKKPVAGVPADILTAEIATMLYEMLKVVGTDVLATRDLHRAFANTGESGQALFNEGASQYLRRCRVRPSMRVNPSSDHLPRSIWGDGATSAECDAKARLNYCRHTSSEVMVVIDITHYVSDQGLEIAHNGVGGAKDMADRVLRDVAKLTRRRPAGVRDLLDEEQAYAALDIPAIIINCGSTWDPATARLLSKYWFRTNVAMGIFSGIWRHFNADASE